MSCGDGQRLASGTCLGPYEIVDLVGTGGMGEVYRARDSRLARDVALKVLPAGSLPDAARLARFEQEARVVGALNHPNVLSVYDTGRQGETVYVVFELLDGETLRRRLDTGPMAPAKAVELAAQIAHGLAAAHERGIVHRDMKPENVFVTRDGRVKLLDFGLAKLRRALDDHAAASDIETPSEITDRGSVVGTPGYMAPEQVRGQPVDARSDVFSFGSVLYELLASKRPFEADTTAETMTAILTKDPPELPPATPAALERIVKRCLEKRPDDRFQSARDVAFALEALSGSGGLRPRSSSSAAIRRMVRHRGSWAAAAGGSAMAVFAAAILLESRNGPALSDRDSIVLTEFENKTGEAVFDGTLRQALAIQLEQSPYLQIVSDDRMRTVLTLMGRSRDHRLTGAVAQEACQREGVKAMLSGAIRRLGSVYVIDLEAINCHTGTALAREQVEAPSQEAVLKALGQAATSLRQKLGESLASIQKFDRPAEEITTSSMEALKFFAAGQEARARVGDGDALALLRKAVELDPDFALAHVLLGAIYTNTGQGPLAQEHARKAYELRHRVSARERAYIEFRYHNDYTGDVRKTIEVLEAWCFAYPRDWTPRNALAWLYVLLGDPERAVPLAEEALRLEPNNYLIYDTAQNAYLTLNRFREADATYDRAVARKVDGMSLHFMRWMSAFAQADEAVQRRESEWANGTAAEAWMRGLEASGLGARGKMRRSRELGRESVATAFRLDMKPSAGHLAMFAAAREAYTGNPDLARPRIDEALALHRGEAQLLTAAELFARIGDAARAQVLLDEAVRLVPPTNTRFHAMLVPPARAAIELARNNAARAVEALRPATPYERGSYNIADLRGRAYLRIGRPGDAAAEFRKVVDNRGTGSIDVLHAVAYVGLARSAAAAGDLATSRRAYEDFLTLWKNADPDVPILRQARAEYQKVRADALEASTPPAQTPPGSIP